MDESLRQVSTIFNSIFVMLLSGLIISSCSADKEGAASISGTYVNMYSADVMNPETGELWGRRTIRDSLFIKQREAYFEISNRKWMHNTYDRKGWVTSMQGETESIQTYVTKFDSDQHALVPITLNDGPPLFIEGRKIFLGKAKALTYVKTK
jgi:hypothetical protein